MKFYNLFSKQVLAVALLALFVRFSYGQGNSVPNGVAGDYNGSITTGGSFDPYTGNAKRVIEDIAVPGSVGAYPLKWNRILNTRGNNHTYFGTGGSWHHPYDWRINVRHPYIPPPGTPPPEDPFVSPNITASFPDGKFVGFFSSGFGGFESPEGLAYWITLASPGDNYNHNLLLTDGGIVRFRQTPIRDFNGQPITDETAREIVDPYGQVTKLEYDPTAQFFKLIKVTEPGGRYLQINWIQFPIPDHWGMVYATLIGSVQAFDDRGNLLETVSYSYLAVVNGNYRNAHLVGVSYSDGTTANYTYQLSNTGGTGEPGLVSQCDDVRYAGPMRTIKYEYLTGGGDVGWGQIKAEKNANGQIVSQLTYPVYNPFPDPFDTAPFLRTETRGDGTTRKFQYDIYTSKLASYTDFKDKWTFISNVYNPAQGSRLRTVTDARGKHTDQLFGYWTNELQKITYADGKFVTFEHSDSVHPYFLTARTDERGNRTVFTRDPNHRITRTDYPPDEDGVLPYETFEYNGFSQIVKHRLTNGAYEHFAYDARGLLLKKWSPTWHTTALEEDDKTTYTYYTSSPWIDRVESETDPRGNVTFYEYDLSFDSSGQMTMTPCAGRGLVTKVRFPNDTHTGAYPSGTSRSCNFNKWGDKLWEENELGQRTTYTYDEDGYGRVRTVKDPLNPPTTYTYKPTNGANTSSSVLTANAPDTITSPMGIVTKNGYDQNLRKTSTTLGSGTPPATTTVAYDDVGNPIQVTDPLNHATITTYDGRNRKKTAEDALHHITTFNYDDASNVTSIVYPDHTETKTYDNLNRVLTATVPRDGIAANNLITKWKYNPSGTVLSVTDPKNQITTFEYDAAGSKTKMTYPNATDYQAWTYDGMKNLVARRTVNGAVQNFSYDERSRKTGMWWTSDGSAPNFTADWANFGYDAASRLTSANNPTSSIVRNYDEAGRLKLDKQILPPPPPVMPVTVVSRKIHGAAGNFDITLPLSGTVAVEPRDGGGSHTLILTFAHSISYSDVSLTAGTVYSTSATLSADQTQVTLVLNGVANAQTIVVTLVGVTDGTVVNNVSVGMAVLLGDVSCNRMVTGSDKNLCKAQIGAEVSASNFLCDVNLTGSITGGDVNIIGAQSGAELPAADPLTQTPPANRQVYVRYEYDNDNKQTRLSVDGAEYDRTFTYDNNKGRFEKIKNTSSGGAELFQYFYDAASNETQRRNLINGVDQIYTRDELNRMKQRDVKKGGSTISTQKYGFDEMSRLTSTERLENAEDKLDTFGYDFSGQLTSANYGWTYNGTTWVNPARPVSYTWDKAGNRDHVVDAGSTINYTTTNLNQYLVAGTDAVYNGSEHEISSFKGQTYGYVNDERLASITSASDTYQMAYDALGRCIKRTLNGVITYYVYDGEKPILEYNNVYQRVAANLYGKAIDEILMRTDYAVTPNVTLYYQDDHEGSVTHLTDGSGNVIESYRYDAFGAPTIFNSTSQPINSSTVGNRFMFTGREYAQKFGVYEYRNRAYHPGLGRFTSEDPMGFAAGDINLFRYCGNDPIDRVDPMGLEGEYFQDLGNAERLARSQVMAEVSNPDRKSVVVKLRSVDSHLPRLVRAFPSVMVPILEGPSGKGYVLGKMAYGDVQRLPNGKYIEIEATNRKSFSRLVEPIHSHNNTRGERYGLGEDQWSQPDRERKRVQRMDESKPGLWYRRMLQKDGNYKEDKFYDNGSQQRSASNDGSQSSSGSQLIVPSAAEIDKAHQATGVPSLAAEAVNFAPGRP